jgi:hypothetical protein
MRALLLSIAVLAAAGCGPSEEGKSNLTTSVAPNGDDTATATAPLKTVTLHVDGGSDNKRVIPAIPRGAEMRVEGILQIDEKSKDIPNPVVQIVHREDGRDVVYNSAVTDQKRDGGTIEFKSLIKAPDTTGAFRINAVHKGRVLCSSELRVE